jgi:hypothetical protein
VLEAIVGQDHVALGIAREQRASGGDSVARNDDREARAREQQRLVADAVRIVVGLDRHRLALLVVATVPAAHDARTKAALRERRSERRHERRLAGAAHGDVADDDDRHRRRTLRRMPTRYAIRRRATPSRNRSDSGSVSAASGVNRGAYQAATRRWANAASSKMRRRGAVTTLASPNPRSFRRRRLRGERHVDVARGP